MKYLLNAFSLNMLADLNVRIDVEEISLENAKRLAPEYQSFVGHPDTAVIFTSQLGIDVAENRETIAVKAGDEALVGQYRGPRLPAGAKTLPDGATIVWCYVQVE